MYIYEPDERADWYWVVFYHRPKIWNAHGETIAQLVPFIPSSFGSAPCDPAKKLNLGYKAWEFQLHMYPLCPTLFQHLLPPQYWCHFCKLVTGIHIWQHPYTVSLRKSSCLSTNCLCALL